MEVEQDAEAQDPSEWLTCAVMDCAGVAVTAGQRCIAHAETPEEYERVLEPATRGQLDVRGVELTPQILGDILRRLPQLDGRPHLRRAYFAKSSIPSDANFRGIIFGTTIFSRATFANGASFDDTIFEDVVTDFQSAQFGHDASFSRVLFLNRAEFRDATFGDNLTMIGVSFEGGVDFSGTAFGQGSQFAAALIGWRSSFENAALGRNASFAGAEIGDWFSAVDAEFGSSLSVAGSVFGRGARFDHVRFGDWADFKGARFGDGCGFENCNFGRDASFSNTNFGDGASFAGSSFGLASRVGPLGTPGSISFQRCTLSEGVDLHVTGAFLDLTGLKGLGDLSIHVLRAEIDARDAQFGGPTSLTTQKPSSNGEIEVPSDGPPVPARLISLRGANVAGLVIVGLDLRACRFARSHSLDELGLEGGVEFPLAPPGIHYGRAFPFLWRWTRRLTIVEEHLYRASSAKPTGWLPSDCLQTEVSHDPPAQVDRAINELRELRDRYEVRYRIYIEDSALEAAAQWAAELSSDSRVTARASDLINEAAVRARRLGHDPPRELAELERELEQVRAAKENAIEVQEFERAASLRDKERKLATKRREVVRQWRRKAQSDDEKPFPRLARSGIEDIAASRVGLVLASREPDFVKEGSLHAIEVASMYRSLRKGREDARDAPGAGDFYYGEMEMRRRGSARVGERALLTAYWALSGYSLRPARSFAALLAVLAIGLLGLHRWGFEADVSWGRAVTFTTSSALFRSTGVDLTVWGEGMQIGLRIVTPVLAALTILAIRGRVKR